MPTLELVSKLKPDAPTERINVNIGANLMDAIIQAQKPIGSSCGAVAVCARCAVQILSGMENLSKPNVMEKKLLEREKMAVDMRISCLTRILGDIKITASYW